MDDYQRINADTINQWVKTGWEWGKPITHEQYARAKRGDWQVLLTPTKPVPHSWFGQMRGKKLLGLASGGAQQMPIFVALGAHCTVLDYSELQLQSEADFAEREKYNIRIVHADMTKPLPFADEEFDIIFHPVSNVFCEQVEPIFKECFRILKKGGTLLSGLDTGVNFFVDEQERQIVNSLPFNPLKNEQYLAQLQANNDGIQFSHTLDEQLGGQLRAGFALVDLYEDFNGYGRLHELNIPTFVATKAIKK